MVYSLIRTPRLPVVDWTDPPPPDLNGLVRFAERPNLVSACVPSRFERALLLIFSVQIRITCLLQCCHGWRIQKKIQFSRYTLHGSGRILWWFHCTISWLLFSRYVLWLSLILVPLWLLETCYCNTHLCHWHSLYPDYCELGWTSICGRNQKCIQNFNWEASEEVALGRCR